MIQPSKVQKLGSLAAKALPSSIKDKASGVIPEIGEKAKDLLPNMSEKDLFIEATKILKDGFTILEEQAAKFTLSESTVLQKVQDLNPDYTFHKIDELCILRSYEVAKLVEQYKSKDILLAAAEGGGLGALGFWGLPFNLVLSIFLYFRAVQSIAMYYGYDVKNDAAELSIASDVFMNAMNPSSSRVGSEQSNNIYKLMLMSHAAVVKQTAKKTWADMAKRGGVPLLLTQMRALAHKSAQKALTNAGKKGLEKTLFTEVFEQIGRKLTLRTIGKAVPVVSAALGALIDTSQMKQVLDYADVFYQKRFILEKEERVSLLINQAKDIIEADVTETDEDDH